MKTKTLVKKLHKAFPGKYISLEKATVWKTYEDVLDEFWSIYVEDHHCLQNIPQDAVEATVESIIGGEKA